MSWIQIAKVLPGRKAETIRNHHVYLKSRDSAPKEFRRKYSAAEDRLLLELTEAGIPWEERVTRFEDRSYWSLIQRLTKLTEPKTKGNFTPEEDNLLIEALELGITVEEVSQLI